MSKLDDAIQAVTKHLAELTATRSRGYSVEVPARDNEYSIHSLHIVLYDTDGNVAAIIINRDILQNYLADTDPT